MKRGEVLANTRWIRGAHNYLSDLLTDGPNADWRRRGGRVVPEGMRDVVVATPRNRMVGWSGAPQTGGRGMAHIVAKIAYGTWKSTRVGYVKWVCGGHTTYPVLGGDPQDRKECDRCRRLA